MMEFDKCAMAYAPLRYESSTRGGGLCVCRRGWKPPGFLERNLQPAEAGFVCVDAVSNRRGFVCVGYCEFFNRAKTAAKRAELIGFAKCSSKPAAIARSRSDSLA